jgi:enoyl-CoA hydratase/carnithine racemase
MYTEYFDLLEDSAAWADMRAIVLTGAGRGFHAGADMASLQTFDGRGRERGGRGRTPAAHVSAHDPEADRAAISSDLPTARRSPPSGSR